MAPVVVMDTVYCVWWLVMSCDCSNVLVMVLHQLLLKSVSEVN